jgi:hypothetical protein
VYDTKGNLITTTSTLKDTLRDFATIEYNNDNLPFRIIHSSPFYKAQEDVEYNAKKQWTKKTTTFPNGKTEVVKAEYDDNGYRTRIIYPSDNDRQLTHTYEYKDGNLVKMMTYFGKSRDSLAYVIAYQYSNELAIPANQRDYAGEELVAGGPSPSNNRVIKTEQKVYVYDEEENLTGFDTYTRTFTYELNAENRLVKQVMNYIGDVAAVGGSGRQLITSSATSRIEYNTCQDSPKDK